MESDQVERRALENADNARPSGARGGTAKAGASKGPAVDVRVNDFALKLPSQIEAGASLPLAESAAANGPIGGSMVLFLIDQTAAENRPLELEIPSSTGETGTIELDL